MPRRERRLTPAQQKAQDQAAREALAEAEAALIATIRDLVDAVEDEVTS